MLNQAPGHWVRILVILLSTCVAQADPPAKDVNSSKPEIVRLVFVGDIMLDELPGAAIARGDDPFRHFADVLRSADAAIGNLECVIAAGGKPEDKKYTFRAHPRCAGVLAKHFDALSVANNHSGDYGKEAFAEQLKILKAAGLPYFGGGHDWKEAHTPLILELRGLRIALLGYNEFKPRSFEAGQNTPGLAWSGGEDDQVIADIRAAREQHKADLVIPYMHWGWEHEPENDRQRELARKMIDAGADVVVGGHPHVTQGVEYYRNRLIVYSIGNFVFNGFEEEEARRGWVLQLTLNKDGLVEWNTVVARLDEEGIPHPAPKTESPRGKVRSVGTAD